MSSIFERLESNVRSYCRSFPTTFTTAHDALLIDERGVEYIDFLAGAGSLNYGHNNRQLKQPLLDYLHSDGVLHGLDMHTEAKARFLEVLEEHILWPLELDYKVQFTGPTGTNAVEAAFKLARRVTGRTGVVSFTNGFHGVSLGSLAATGNGRLRGAGGVPLDDVTFMPYDGYLGEDVNTIDYLEAFLTDDGSGLGLPAAIIVETVQGEGGVNTARFEWLRSLEKLCQQLQILLIIDDVQVGCGRTGTFFSFEKAAIVPDIVTLSKSLSGYGLPMSVVLMKAGLDEWKPGEHNGTFRGNNLAFVTAAKAIELYWRDLSFTQEVLRKGERLRERLEQIVSEASVDCLAIRGRGMIYGLASRECPRLMNAVSAAAFERGLIVETSGADNHVLKLLPPLTIDDELLERGLDILSESFDAVLSDPHKCRDLGLAIVG